MRFSKMQGLGNDFMVIESLNQNVSLNTDVLKQWADRKFGVGFDQCLLIAPPKDRSYDFHYRIFNADGSEVGQCGNGARCVAQFIKTHKLSSKEEILLRTSSTTIKAKVHNNDSVSLWLPPPKFSHSDVPIESAQTGPLYHLSHHAKELKLYALSLGNPHGVILVDDFSEYDLRELGEQLNQHPFFPEGANINFVKIIDKENLELRTFERGSGLTLACGSGATAAFAIHKLFLQGANKTQVRLASGHLDFFWKDKASDIEMVGPAVLVFQGEIST